MNQEMKWDVMKKFGNIASFARALKWSYRKTREIVTGQQLPTADDMKEMANAMEIDSADDFMKFFYGDKPQSGHKVNT